MTDSSDPLGESYPASDRTSGKWLQLVLFGIGGVLFLGGVVTAGLPGTMLGLSLSDDPGASTPVATETARSSPTSAATATPTGQPTSTAAPPSKGRAGSTAGPSGEVVFRINVGGPRIRTGSGPAWSADTDRSPSKYLNARRSDTVISSTPDNITIERNVPRTAPRKMFTDYRFERGANRGPSQPMVWRFPAETNRTYEVRIYVLEGYFTRGPPTRPGEERYSKGGPRTFGISIENRTVARNYEPIAAHGHDVGGVRTFNATTDDGVLTVTFLRERENPTVSGIEIVDTGPRTVRGTNATRSPSNRRGGQTQPTRRTQGGNTTRSGGMAGGSQAGARDGGRGNQTASPTPTPVPANEEDDGFFG